MYYSETKFKLTLTNLKLTKGITYNERI